MRYLYVKCIHNDPAAPVHIYSEIGDDGYERRKVEIYADGRKGFAVEGEEAGGTVLGSLPVPSLKEIAAQPGYEPKAIDPEDFHKIWMRRR